MDSIPVGTRSYAISDPAWHQLFVDCMVDLCAHNIKVMLVTDKLTLDGDHACQGYWDDGNWRKPELYCQVSPFKNWVTTFVHEYNHFVQFRERTHEWWRMRRYTQNDDTKLFTDAPYNRKRMLNFIYDTRALEHDCEQRTVEKFREYGINQQEIDQYCREANIYLHFYTYTQWYRDWPKDVTKAPMRNAQCLAAANTTIDSDCETIPDKLLGAFIDQYPPKYEVTQ